MYSIGGGRGRAWKWCCLIRMKIFLNQRFPEFELLRFAAGMPLNRSKWKAAMDYGKYFTIWTNSKQADVASYALQDGMLANHSVIKRCTLIINQLGPKR